MNQVCANKTVNYGIVVMITNLRLLVESSDIPTNNVLDACERIILENRPADTQPLLEQHFQL